MVNQELVNYIKNALNQGFLEEEIRKELIRAGWRIEDIIQGFATVRRGEKPAVPPVPGDRSQQPLRSGAPGVHSFTKPNEDQKVVAVTASPKKKGGRKLFLIIGVVIALAALGGGGYFYYINYIADTSPIEIPVDGGIGDTATESDPGFQSENFYFKSPESGSVINVGDTIAVEIYGEVKELLVVAPDFSETLVNDGSNVFVVDYTTQKIGEITLGATGKTSDGQFVGISQNLVLNVVPPGKVSSLRLIPDELTLNVGESSQLEVYGTFKGGEEYKITSVKFGTEYVLYPGQPLGIDIVTVDDEGIITAVNAGKITIGVTHEDEPDAVDIVITVLEVSE